MKPRLKRIPITGLRCNEKYVEVGDGIEVFPLLRGNGEPRSFYAVVKRVKRNHYGRISYEIYLNDGVKKKLVITEELTPLGYKGCQ